jgi:hypothetical protein
VIDPARLPPKLKSKEDISENPEISWLVFAVGQSEKWKSYGAQNLGFI